MSPLEKKVQVNWRSFRAMGKFKWKIGKPTFKQETQRAEWFSLMLYKTKERVCSQGKMKLEP